ncbi:DUF2937 family protein [Alteromonas sp. CYL-A6]|uniref:DUF2937 family protein n=1 Tax=Alteromonas nitratireducens TaxID=3390813 RepID=UPI0034B801F1
MGIISRTLDKLVFAALLLVTMQVPILADHYLQYLSGYADATQAQVSQYQRLADEFGYPSVQAMIDDLSRSDTPLIKADAQNKAAQISQLHALQEGISVLKDGHYFAQAWYMVQPARTDTLRRVLDNFSPSIPLRPTDILFSLIAALGLNLLIISPFAAARAIQHRKAAHRAPPFHTS